MKLFTTEKEIKQLSHRDLTKIRKQRKNLSDERYKYFLAFISFKF